MANVLNGVETLPKISITWVGCTNVTDRRQTDGQAIAYSKRERKFTFAKKSLVQSTIGKSLLFLLYLLNISILNKCINDDQQFESVARGFYNNGIIMKSTDVSYHKNRNNVTIKLWWRRMGRMRLTICRKLRIVAELWIGGWLRSTRHWLRWLQVGITGKIQYIQYSKSLEIMD